MKVYNMTIQARDVLSYLITEFILMKVYNMMIQVRDILLNSAHATVDPTLVV